MGAQILFDPARVSDVLAELPTVASLIPDPVEEGTESVAFPGVLRKTIESYTAGSHTLTMTTWPKSWRSSNGFTRRGAGSGASSGQRVECSS